MSSGLGSSVSLDAIARAACLSPFHVHRSFRAFLGETPHQFVIRLSLEHAAHRLRRTNSSVAEVGWRAASNHRRISAAPSRRASTVHLMPIAAASRADSRSKSSVNSHQKEALSCEATDNLADGVRVQIEAARDLMLSIAIDHLRSSNSSISIFEIVAAAREQIGEGGPRQGPITPRNDRAPRIVTPICLRIASWKPSEPTTIVFR